MRVCFFQHFFLFSLQLILNLNRIIRKSASISFQSVKYPHLFGKNVDDHNTPAATCSLKVASICFDRKPLELKVVILFSHRIENCGLVVGRVVTSHIEKDLFISFSSEGSYHGNRFFTA